MEYLQRKINDINHFFVCFLYVTTIIIIGVFGLFNGQTTVEILKFFILMSIIITILNYVYRIYEMKLLENKLQVIVFITCYLYSLITVMLSKKIELYNIWLLGAIIIAVFIQPYFGLTIHFIVTFLFCTLHQASMESFAYYFIIGAVICIVANYISNRAEILYILIIVGSVNITLLYVIHNFNYLELINLNALNSVLSTLVIIILIYVMKKLPMISKFSQNIMKEEQPIIHSNLDEILNQDSILLQKLNKYSNDLFIHSIEVSDLSARAAKYLGYNEEIARAGGLYHEIGRIKGENYIEEGIKLATEQKFPQEVVDIIKQHNSKYEKPKFIEAAVVMLSDSVISTLNYVATMPNKKNLTREELIDNIIEIRFRKGTLDESGITLQEYKLLKDYYMHN